MKSMGYCSLAAIGPNYKIREKERRREGEKERRREAEKEGFRYQRISTKISFPKFSMKV
jgi:hypothetical protein